MASIYVDLALASGTNAGTSWANAYQGPAGLASALNAAAAGDVIYVKGQKTAYAATLDLLATNGTINNPVMVIGVKSTTTNEPPVSSDLIPGLRSGGSTPAWNDSDVPKITQTSVTYNITIRGYARYWGLYLAAGNQFSFADAAYHNLSGVVGEECWFECNLGAGSGARTIAFGSGGSGARNSLVEFDSCKFRVGDSDDNIIVVQTLTFHNCTFDSRTTYRSGYIAGGGTATWNHGYNATFVGCDFSALTGAIFDIGFLQGERLLMGCKLPSSHTLVTGTRTNAAWRVTNIGSQSNPSLSATDSIRQLEIETTNGSIAEETTIVRTGGANDGGSGSFSWAMTPSVNGTRDNVLALVSPWMAGWIDGDGTSKTLTVYIANSGSGDYQDDEVALEVFSPAESTTTILWAHRTTRTNLLSTPSNITDDTSSDWSTGAGGKNAQKLTCSISPAYDGQVFVRVLFSKNFSASPETLYVDPRIYGTTNPPNGTIPLGMFGGYLGAVAPSSGFVFPSTRRNSVLCRR